jgi:hypothetical protein
MSKIIVFAFPVFLAAMAFEMWWDRRKRSAATSARSSYAFSDTLNSLSLGLLSQVVGVLAKFIGAVSKGWAWTKANPQEAVKKAVNAYPDMSLEWEMKTIDLVMKLSFDANTAKNGWGTFDPQSIEKQIAMFDALKQYETGRPKLADVYTTKILEMTESVRPKI